MHKPITIPGSDKARIKPFFEQTYKSLLGEEYDEFMRYSLSFLRASIRVNTLKSTPAEVKKRLEGKGFSLERIPWCSEGFWVYGERRDLGNLLEHSLGYFYVQESASMLPPVALDIKPGQKVLDICAAPGSKSTQIAQYMEGKGVLVANDHTPLRARPLGLNIQRCGVMNSMLTLMQGHNLAANLPEESFDRVLVDAPCSGTGTIRKSVKTLWEISEGFVKKMAREQKRLVSSAFRVLKKGGILVYSTCTLEPLEDESIISYVLENLGGVTEKISFRGLKTASPVMSWQGKDFHEGVKNCVRVYPHHNDTEGFFVAKIRKNS